MRSGNVIFAINDLSGGGAERVVLELIKNWPRSQTPVLLVARRCGSLLEEVPSHIEVVEVGLPLSALQVFAFLSRLKTIVDRVNPLAIYSHLTAMNRMLLRARSLGLVRATLVVVEHNNLRRNLKISGFRSVMVRLEACILYRSADHVVAVSRGVLDQIRAYLFLPKGRSTVIYNPIDISAVRRGATNGCDEILDGHVGRARRPLFVAAGRMVPQKDFSTLLQAFHLIPSHSRGTLLILGDGPTRSELEIQTLSLGLEGQVIFGGFVRNPYYYMRQADLFVMSSRWEGFGLVLVEALICGTPFVSTDCRYGPSEIVSVFGGGALVPVGSPIDLARKMVEMAGDQFAARMPSDFSCLDSVHVAAMYADLVGLRSASTNISAHSNTKD